MYYVTKMWGGLFTVNKMNSRKNYKFIYLAIFIFLVSFAVWGGYLGGDTSYLNENNSLLIPPEDFTPDLTAHRIDESKIGLQTYSVKLKGSQFSNLSGRELKLIINRPTDNAIRVKFNNRIILTQGDFERGRSMFKNNFVYTVLDPLSIEKINELKIETYSLYKSGIESPAVIIAETAPGTRVIRTLDFFNIKLVLVGLGFLFFSALFTTYIYIISEEKDISLIYCSLATMSLSVYFLDYVQVVLLHADYFTFKKLFLFGLQMGIVFYLLSIRDYIRARSLDIGITLHTFFYLFISIASKNMVQFKTYYQYWYFGLVGLIFLMLFHILKNLKNTNKAFIYLISFLFLGGYTLFAVFIEFKEGYFILNSPLLYMVILASTPLMIGFNAITEKDIKLNTEKMLKEKAFIDSMTDNLTGVWNQRYLKMSLEENKGHLTLAMLDLDNFKDINDTYGHIAGDYALKEISNLIKQNTRKSDDICRYGGDEFVILFNYCEPDDAYQIIDKIRKLIESKVFEFDNYTFRITMSVGLYSTDKQMNSLEILKRVDRALYEAKRDGKNKTVKLNAI